jgi:hypothetical protein
MKHTTNSSIIRKCFRYLTLSSLIIGLGAIVGGCMESEAGGALQSADGVLGTWQFTPDDCQSGQRTSFYGVTMTDEDNPTIKVRYVEDVLQGRILQVRNPKTGKYLQFKEDQCTVFEGGAETQSSKVNDISNIDGHINVDCTYEDPEAGKGHIWGTLTFENCH